MPGERLVCLWQAVHAKDQDPSSGVKTATVRLVTEALRDLPLVYYAPGQFDQRFQGPTVDFDDYLAYVRETLRARGAPRHLLAQQIEQACWDMAAYSYSSSAVNVEDIGKLWQVFNRVARTGTYPPVAAPEELNWLFEKLAGALGRHWTDVSQIPDGGLTFADMLRTLERSLFMGAPAAALRQAIEDVFSWLVREVMKVGWMSKRTKKQSNWTNWQRRWFVLTPTGLEYFVTDKMKTKKGSVLLDANSTMDDMPDFSSFTKKLSFRFRVSNRPALEIEMCAESDLDKQQWMANIARCIQTAATGVTPMSALLLERAKKAQLKHDASVEKTDQQISFFQEAARRGTRRMQKKPPPTKGRAMGSLGDSSEEETNAPPVADELEEYDNNAAEVQREKIQAVFQRIDTDGNGKIDNKEFSGFINSLGLNLTPQESDLIFQGIDKDGNNELFFDEFYDYFVTCVMGNSEMCDAESRLRAAFLAADRDGSGAVSFKEFAEYAWSRRRSMAINRLVEAFEDLDVDKSGEISFKEFREFFSGDEMTKRSSISELGQGVLSEQAKNRPAIEQMLKGVYDAADAKDMANYLRRRWDAFASFRRQGVTGEVVMSGKSGMVGDCVPGEYTLLDLACFNDLPPIEPKCTVIKGVSWQASGISGKSGRLIFPETFNGHLETEFATNENLAYYGCSLAEGSQLKVSLLYRHGMQDFTYENNYLDNYVLAEEALGGAGLEQHGFSHLDCPLDQESGMFVLGKLEGDELHLTGFKIPTRHTLYIPPFTIHCNDYLKGTWRTMLSDEAEINHVQLVRRQRTAQLETFQFFKFSFEPLRI